MAFRPLKSFFSTADELLQQDLPTLGGVLLTHLKSYEGLNTVYQHAGLHRGYFRAMLENRNVGLGPLPKEPEYGARQPDVTKRMMEAWNWLERQGLLIHNDQQVADWFSISSDGEKYLDQDKLSAPPSPNPARVSRSATAAPRAFLSYSWDGQEHQQWVNEFAERLQGESGVEIIFDRWHLNPGDDKLQFMEQAVVDSNFVIVVCTPTYAERANKRQGGVGYESMVITAELAAHILTNKFIPVLRKGTWTSSLPVYLKSRMGVNLSDEPYHEDEYERLLRVLHGEPIQPPPLGSKPDFSRKPVSKIKPSAVSDAKDGTPAQLQPAIKHIQNVFDESDWKCSWITQHLCYADLHQHPGIIREDQLTQYRAAFLDLREIVGAQISKQFDLTVAPGTPSAIFHGYAEMYRYGLNTAVRDMLTEALQIGFSNTALMGNDPVEWARSQVENRLQNGRHRFASWIKNVCDIQPALTQTPVTDDADEMIWWRKWRAPRFIHMHPSGNTPYNESTAWTREDEHRTSQVLDGLSKRFNQFVEIELDQLVGRAQVQRAKRGVAAVSQAQSVQDISRVDAADDYKFARMAIEQARKSVAEQDGRMHPLVGAVVVKDGKVLSAAHRGEIAEGNHAEFVALEKKLANVTLAGATVYTTLEPCTTRNHPKVPCAERLIERKVARVVMGMLDPDERIRGLGQMKLRTANIATQFFPVDLMSEVEELNREFIRDRGRG